MPAWVLPAALAAAGGGLGVALGPKEEPVWKRFLIGATIGGTAGLGLGAAGAAGTVKGAGAIAKAGLDAGTAKGLGAAYAATAPAIPQALTSLGGAVAANPGTAAMLGLGGASALLPGGSNPNYTSSFQGPASWEEQQGAGTGTYYV
jgi:hypothetical protein